MRYWSVAFVVAFIVFSSAVHADPLYSVRPLDALSLEALNHAISRSAVARSLIETLEASDVIVHVVSVRNLPAGIGGTTTFVVSRGGYRYLRITIGAQLPPAWRAAILAHELQHAREIAESGAADPAAVEALFERCGTRVGNYFETQAARDVEAAVRVEVQGARRALQAEPVVKFHH
jgi:hypothetical protein